MSRPQWVAACFAGALVVGLFVLDSFETPRTHTPMNGEWLTFAADLHSSKYSALDQITHNNVHLLTPAWKWSVDDVDGPTGARRRGLFRSTPLMANDTLYVSTALNIVVARDPGTGEPRWVHDQKAYEFQMPCIGLNSRGVAFWNDGEDAERIILATGSSQLISIDASTGESTSGFGDGGIVDLTQGLKREISRSQYSVTSPPTICRDTIVVGSSVWDRGRTQRMPPGDVRGYDVRTGEMKWIFHTIPQAGEFGVGTWDNDSWEYTGSTNVWSMMSCDEELGFVYLPTGTATNDWYGGHRLGDNLFAESLVCLEAETGKRVWHFQGVRHGVWDYDFASAPNLVDITVDGRLIKAVAQVSKQGFTYVLDRVTGEPVWPIEDRQVPASTVPGERLSVTQPFPTKPPPFERQGITTDDLIDFTPELRAEALTIVEDFVIGPLFTPPIVAGQDGKEGTIQVPGLLGGANWPGAAFDPETGFLFVPSSTYPSVLALERGGTSSDLDYLFKTWTREPPRPRGLPLLKPPYSRITAIDLNAGTIAWQVARGDGPREQVNLILGGNRDVGPLGSAINAAVITNGLLLTKTLLFANEASPPTGGIMRAFDKESGQTVWEQAIETEPFGAPITYVYEGKQYIVFATGGRRYAPELRAYALP